MADYGHKEQSDALETSFGVPVSPPHDPRVVEQDGFKIGMVVRLASGGPNMTVWGLGNDGLIGTSWFDEATLRRDRFAPEELHRMPL